MVELGQREADRMSKKRKGNEEGRRHKKRKLDPILDWGVGDGQEDDEKEDRSIKEWLGIDPIRGKEQEVTLMVLPVHVGKERNTKRWKQMKWSFAKSMEKDEDTETGGERSREYEDNTRQTTKSSKVSPRRRRHTMKQLAEKNTKITSWVKSTEVKVNIDDQVIDDTD